MDGPGLFVLAIALIAIAVAINAIIRAYQSGLREAESKEGPSDSNEKGLSGSNGREKKPVSFEIRYLDTHQQIKNREFPCKEIEIRGSFPNALRRNLDLKIILNDVTGGEKQPVISKIEAFQLKGSTLFGLTHHLGEVDSNQYLPDWTSVGKIFLDILETPYGGNRQIEAQAVLIDHYRSDSFPKIENWPLELIDTVWFNRTTFSLTAKSVGYLSGAKKTTRLREQVVHLAVAVAAIDGRIADEEGNFIKKWIDCQVKAAPEPSREELKRKYNQAFRSAYKQTITRQGLPESVLADIRKEASDSLKYEAMELCYDIMAADGIADRQELRLLDRIARALGLDPDEVQAIRDLRMVGLDTQENTRDDLEGLLGINPDWSPDEVQRYLRSQFRKWNARVTQASSPEEKQHAQQMIDRIARAREKYARAGA